jgi:Ca2+-binding RTX toxin-like protein
MFEQFENRQMLTVTVEPEYPGYWRVIGTEGADFIMVQIDDSTQIGTITYGGQEYSFPEVYVVTVEGRGGDDIISGSVVNGTSGSNGNIVLDGGAGNDNLSVANSGAIWCGPGDDVADLYDVWMGEIYGEDGNDIVTGHGYCPGAVFSGGAGNDYVDLRTVTSPEGNLLLGGSGNDTLIGSSYNDQFWGGPDTDTAYGGGGYNEFYEIENVVGRPPYRPPNPPQY